MIAAVGEPLDIMILPDGAGRLLVYSGWIARLGLQEQTGEEILLELTSWSDALVGPGNTRAGTSASDIRAVLGLSEVEEEKDGILAGQWVDDGGHTASRLSVWIQKGRAAAWNLLWSEDQ